MAEWISSMIAQTAKPGKLLEFHSGLVPAYRTRYAELQRESGPEYPPESGIRVSIADLTGEEARTVSVLVPCYVFDRIREVCVRNTGELRVAGGEALETVIRIRRIEAAVARLGTGLTILIRGTLNALSSLVREEAGSPAKVFGRTLNSLWMFWNGEHETEEETPAGRIPFTLDFRYEQVPAPAGRPGPGGLCPWRGVSICRKGAETASEDAGEHRVQEPWTVAVRAFDAGLQRNTRMPGFPGDGERNAEELRVSLTDDEMYRMVWCAERFLSQWERAHTEGFLAAHRACEAQTGRGRSQ